MKKDQLDTMTDEHLVARKNLGKNMCKVIDDFTEMIFYKCEIRGELLSDEEVYDITVAAMYNLLRNTKDYDGM